MYLITILQAGKLSSVLGTVLAVGHLTGRFGQYPHS